VAFVKADIVSEITWQWRSSLKKPIWFSCFFLSCKTGCVLVPTEKQP